MNKTRKVICYILFDILAAILAWGGLYVFRKLVFESVCGEQLNQMWSDPNFWWGITLVPLGWIVLYTIQGTYKDVYRKARLKEFQQENEYEPTDSDLEYISRHLDILLINREEDMTHLEYM